MIAAVREGIQPIKDRQQSVSESMFRLTYVLNESWLEQHWILVGYAARVGIAAAIQILLADMTNADNNTDLVQGLTTALVVMIIPVDRVREGSHTHIHTRMIHRAVGALQVACTAFCCCLYFSRVSGSCPWHLRLAS